MRLQAARLALPLLLAQHKGALRDLGTHDDVRSIEITLDAPLTMTIDIDPKTSRVVRSVGRSKDVAFTTVTLRSIRMDSSAMSPAAASTPTCRSDRNSPSSTTAPLCCMKAAA